MIKTVQWEGEYYPHFQTLGNAAQFAIPFAKHVCAGTGFDIGCGRLEWSYPGSIPVDPAINEYDADKLPPEPNYVDYIFSSHCLEHVPGNWYNTLKGWKGRIRNGGVLFLYLPDYSQRYWRPWNNSKHNHIFTPQIMKDAFTSLNMSRIFVSGVDLNNSFMIMGTV
jgi:predicted SAM-dependent methyltransferase